MRPPLPILLVPALWLAATACGWRAPKPVPDPVPGEQARVTVKCPAPRRFDICEQRTGTLVGITPDSVRFRAGGAAPERAYAIDDLHQLEVTREQGGNTMLGVGVGAVVGLILGTAASAGECDDGGSTGCVPPGPFIGMAVGGAVGALAGSRMRRNRWVPVVLPPPRQTAAPE